MSGRTKGEIAMERWRSIWRLKRQGYSQRSVARIMKLGKSTVAYYIGKGEPPRPDRLVRTTRHEPMLDARKAAVTRPIVDRPGPLLAYPAADRGSADRRGKQRGGSSGGRGMSST